MVPVDHVARLTVACAFEPPVDLVGVAQVTSHPRLRMSHFLGALERFGYKVPEVPYDDWKQAMKDYVASGKEEHAL